MDHSGTEYIPTQNPRLAPLFPVAKNLSGELLMTQSVSRTVWTKKSSIVPENQFAASVHILILVRSGYIFVVFFTRNGPHRRRIFGTEPTKAVIKRFVRLDHFMTVVEQNVFEVHSAL